MGYQLDFSAAYENWDVLLAGLWLSIRLAATATAAGTAAAVPLALCKLSGGRTVRLAVSAYVEVVRNTPLLVQVFFVYFALPGIGLRLRPDAAAIVALAANTAAYEAEIIRAGLQAVPRGQIEAGRALGLRPLQVFRLVVLRPAIKAVYPALTSQFNVVLLGTSVVSAIAAAELTHEAETIISLTFRSFEIYAVVGAIYLVTAWGFGLLFSAAYKRLFSYPDAG